MSRVAISEAWAVEECVERVSAWWLLRVVRVRESSVVVSIHSWTYQQRLYFLMRFQLLGLEALELVEGLREIH